MVPLKYIFVSKMTSPMLAFLFFEMKYTGIISTLYTGMFNKLYLWAHG